MESLGKRLPLIRDPCGEKDGHLDQLECEQDECHCSDI